MAKKLLNEAQMQRFAKLANLSPVNEMMSSYEEDMEEEMPEMGEEAPEMADEMPAEEPEMEEMPAEEEPEVEGDLEMSADEIQAILDLADKLRPLIDAEPEAEMPAEEPEMDAEPEAEVAPEMDEEDSELMEALAGINYVAEKKDIVEEVARRVAKRLLKAKKADQALKEALGNKK